MATVGAIIAFILTPILWLLYHKVFGVIYFGGVGRGIFKELFGCFIVSIIIVSVFGAFGGALLGVAGGALAGLLTIILCLLKWVLILGAIGGVIYLIYSLITKKKKINEDINPTSEEETEDVAVMQITSEQDTHEGTSAAEQKEAVPINSDIQRSVPESGEPVTEDGSGAVSESDAKSSNIQETKFCAFCGKKINRSQKFCNYCGKECIS